MDADRSEQNNLAGKMPERVEAMSAEWDAWAGLASVDAWQGKKAGKRAKNKK